MQKYLNFRAKIQTSGSIFLAILGAKIQIFEKNINNTFMRLFCGFKNRKINVFPIFGAKIQIFENIKETQFFVIFKHRKINIWLENWNIWKTLKKIFCFENWNVTFLLSFQPLCKSTKGISQIRGNGLKHSSWTIKDSKSVKTVSFSCTEKNLSNLSHYCHKAQ